MFGKHLEPAEATVLFVEIQGNVTRNTAHGVQRKYALILDVRTPTGHVFRAPTQEYFVLFSHPKVGDRVKVRYDPKSLKVELDTKGDRRYDMAAQDLAQKAERAAILAAPAGTPLLQDGKQQAHQALREHMILRKELLSTGAEGMGTILRMVDACLPFPPFVSYRVDARVVPAVNGFAFECACTIWVNTRNRPLGLQPGDCFPVRYDPRDPSRIVFQF